MRTFRGFLFLIPLFFLIGLLWSVSFLEYQYSQAQFDRMSQIGMKLEETDPEAAQAFLAALKETEPWSDSAAGVKARDFLLQYGYRRGDFIMERRLLLWMVFLGSVCPGSLFLITGLFRWQSNKRGRIEELTGYLKRINTDGDAAIWQMQEDDFSMLQDAIYKTVTVLYQTREAAVKAKEHQAEHLANIAHQLKTAITAASVSLQMIREEASLVFAQRARHHLERLARLEEKLLLLIRIDSGTLKLRQERVDIYTALNLAADSLRELPVGQNKTVLIPERGCVTILGDLDWTIEGLINLMKNCLEHSPEGGCVTCDYSGNALYTEIVIRDEGEGFSKEDILHLFERFYRGKNAAEDSMGIGLALTRSIFEMQNGMITARNLPEGGACFEIRVYHKEQSD